MKVSTYRKTYFVEGDAPDVRTVRAMWQRGEIYGKRIGKVLYVDPDVSMTIGHAPEPLTVSPLAQKVLAG